MHLKEYFYDKNVPDNTQTNRFRLPSTWSPGIGRDKFLDCYINAVDKTILEGSSSNKKLRSNMTKLERDAINALRHDKNIVIFQADKGAAVVVQNKTDYLAEAYNQLNGKDENGDDVYLHVAHDPTAGFVAKVTEAINQALHMGTIDEETAKYLILKDAKPGNIYFVPKIHNHSVHLLPGPSATQSAQPRQTSPNGLMTSYNP